MRPNLLVIMSDQHNPHLGGFAGNQIVRTPNLDALARKGVQFDSTYCAAPVCLPSRMAFLTSQSSTDLRMWTNEALLDPYQPTFAHQLVRANYEAVLCGRMHFPDPDQRHGFQRRLVGDVNGARDTSRHLFEDQLPVHVTDQDYRSVVASGPGSTSYITYDDHVTARAQRFLAQWSSNPSAEAFCLTVGYLLPHNPYVCPRPLFEEYMDKIELPMGADAVPDDHPAVQRLRAARGVSRLSSEDIRRALAAYYGLVTYLDQGVGRIIDTLTETSLLEDTVVVYVSDHGDMANEHNLWWKETFYEGSVRVPMIWSWPGQFAGNRRISAPTSLLDVGPTLLDLADAEPLPAARGRSLVPELSGRNGAEWHRAVFSEVFPQHPDPLDPGVMIRRGKWKLNVYHGFEHPQLFDMAEDPQEKNDLGRSPYHVEIREKLLALARDYWFGKEVVRESRVRSQQYRCILDWHRRVQVGESEIWRPPLKSNWLEDSRSN